jgi:hypothetical protein
MDTGVDGWVASGNGVFTLAGDYGTLTYDSVANSLT